MNAPTTIIHPVLSGEVVDEAVQVVAEPEQLFAWAKDAKPGDRFVYATRMVLPAKSAGGRAARNLYERGLVQLCQRRVAGTSLRNYEAQRTKRAWPGLDPVVRTSSGDFVNLDDETGAANALLPVLARAAQFGRPCPTDRQLATSARVRLETVKPGLDVLRAINAIRIKGVKAPTCRIVTIVGTGHSTGYAR
ncbi:hypothetical protein [Sphingomonas beigongshangi]|uniref:hypothetical protein n=1 Tax=Sphingomonas beigongshangi TaxID=2782540 RepID=UPI001AEE1DAA|nr:hypothetical protein [Sphingomonas beigongshangi]